MIAEQLRRPASTATRRPTSAIVIEKPFGTDLASARKLQRGPVERLRASARSSASTTTWARRRSRTCWRSGSRTCMFEPVWNRNYIDHVQITAAEDIGIGTRAGYYDSSGRAARPRPEPHAPAADAAVHGAAGRRSTPTRCATRRSRCCDAIQPPTPSEVAEMTVRAQYAAGVAGRRGRAGLPRGGRRARRLADRDLRGAAAARSTTGAGRACRSSCAPASGCRAR